MEEKETAPSDQTMPYASALAEVVKGLRNDPVLLFGIGAGIIVVGVLALNSDTRALLIVAALLLVVLFARLHQDAHRVQKRGTVLDVSARASSVEGSDVANVLSPKATRRCARGSSGRV